MSKGGFLSICASSISFRETQSMRLAKEILRLQGATRATMDELKALRGIAKKVGLETRHSESEIIYCMSELAEYGYSADRLLSLVPEIANLATKMRFSFFMVSDLYMGRTC